MVCATRSTRGRVSLDTCRSGSSTRSPEALAVVACCGLQVGVTMRSLAVRLGCALIIMAVACLVQDDQLAAAQGGVVQLIYAAQDDGTIHVYDIGNRHAE